MAHAFGVAELRMVRAVANMMRRLEFAQNESSGPIGKY
jgi:hypothetical protein